MNIKAFFSNAFKRRTVGFYITLSAAGVALISTLLYVITDGTDRTFSVIAFVFGLIGSLTVAVTVFTDLSFAPLIPTLFYVAAFALALNVTLPSLSDVWNGVNFIGGNATLGTIFSALYLLCSIVSTVGCFMAQRKQEGFSAA